MTRKGFLHPNARMACSHPHTCAKICDWFRVEYIQKARHGDVVFGTYETVSMKPSDLPNTTALYVRAVDNGQIGSNAPWYADR